MNFSLEPPAFGQIRVANEMRKLRHPISPAYARGVWQRHDPGGLRQESARTAAGTGGVIDAEAQFAVCEAEDAVVSSPASYTFVLSAKSHTML